MSSFDGLKSFETPDRGGGEVVGGGSDDEGVGELGHELKKREGSVEGSRPRGGKFDTDLSG